MKIKYPILLLVAAYGLAVNSFADEQRPLENQAPTIKVKVHGGTNPELTIESNSQTVKIKAHGETVAELKVAHNGAVVIRGGVQVVAMNRIHFIPVDGGLISVQIDCVGGFPITLQADEVEFINQGQPAMLFAPTVPAQ